MRHLALCFVVALLGISQAQAALVKSLDFSIHQEYVSTRALGMGNAFTAVADDFSAIFYNPAALALRTDGQLHMFLQAAADPNLLKLKGELADVKNQPQDQQSQGYSDLIENLKGDHFFARVPTIGAAWVRPGWGIAFIPADLSLDIDDNQLAGPSLNVNTYLDSTLAFSYAHKLNWLGPNQDLAWGVTLKAVHRIYVGEIITSGDLLQGTSVFSTSNAAEGITGDTDLGTYWTPAWKRSHFAFVGRNLLNLGFKWNPHLLKGSTNDPPPLGRRFDFGSKFDLPRWWVFDPHFSADIRDVGDENWTLKKGYHLGLELYWTMYSWWKGHWSVGVNQNYLTAGFGARFAWFQLDLATYGEEVGTASAPEQDRRYLVELALDF